MEALTLWTPVSLCRSGGAACTAQHSTEMTNWSPSSLSLNSLWNMTWQGQRGLSLLNLSLCPIQSLCCVQLVIRSPDLAVAVPSMGSRHDLTHPYPLIDSPELFPLGFQYGAWWAFVQSEVRCWGLGHGLRSMGLIWSAMAWSGPHSRRLRLSTQVLLSPGRDMTWPH